MTTQTEAEPAYRWVIVTVAALIMGIGIGGIVNGLAAYVVPMAETFGWDRGPVSMINFSGLMGLALGGYFAGRLSERFGTRPVVVFGASVLALGHVLASYTDTLWQLYVIFAVAGFFGAGAIVAPLMALVGSWFRTGAGLALGLVSAGQAFGQGSVPFGSSFLIKAYGVQGALAATGIIMALIVVPLALLLRPPPLLSAASQAAQAEEEAVSIPTNILVTRMCAAILLCCTCMAVPLMHLVPLVQDRGIPAEQASSVLFVMMTVAILGRVAFGKLADMIGAIPTYMTAVGWMTVMIYGFMVMNSLTGFYLYAVLYGFGYAGVMTGVLVVMRMHTPPSRRASALGMVLMFGYFGHAIGGYLGGLLYDLTGGYSAAYALAALAGAGNLLIVSTLLIRSRAPRQLQPAE